MNDGSLTEALGICRGWSEDFVYAACWRPNDVAAHEVFVPADRHFIPLGPHADKPIHPGPLYGTSLDRIIGVPLAAVGLGLARDAIDSFKTIAVAKTPHASSTTLDQQHTTQLRVGQAEAALRSGRALLYAVARDMDAALEAGRGVDDDMLASAMLARAQAVACAVQAVDLILDAAGTASVFEGARLERCSRDIRMVPRHFIVGPSGFEMVGQYLLGGPLQMRRQASAHVRYARASIQALVSPNTSSLRGRSADRGSGPRTASASYPRISIWPRL
jgi:indole-3-acetate monooxygenase